LRPEFWQREPLAIYLEKSYRGVAILEPASVAPYLTKFAVEPLARGEGLGQDIWQALTREQRSLVWRSRISNPIARWYAGVCDGMMRVDGWQVFWRGISSTDVPRAIEEAVAKPHDFADVC
jgi:acetylglutamate kinase